MTLTASDWTVASSRFMLLAGGSPFTDCTACNERFTEGDVVETRCTEANEKGVTLNLFHKECNA